MYLSKKKLSKMFVKDFKSDEQISLIKFRISSIYIKSDKDRLQDLTKENSFNST